MKILLVHNRYQQQGGEDVVFEQEKDMLARAGHDVITYVRSNSEADMYSGPLRVQLAARTIWARDTYEAFPKLLHKAAPDLVHIHNTFFMISPSIFSACKKAGVPVVSTLHNYRLCCPAATFFRDGHPCEECVDHGLWRGIAHGCYHDSRLATATVALMLAVHRYRATWIHDLECHITLTEFARSRFLRAGIPAEKLVVKPNFVYPDPGVDQSSDRQYALFVGRLSDARLRTILDAWHLLPMIPLIVVGGGPDLERMKAEARSRGLVNVTFAGHLPRAQTIQAMQGAKFLVFTSEWYENFPVTIAESFASGVPVICSRLGAMAEIVDDGRTGLHFRAGDPSELAAKVKWLWAHEDQIRAMGREARREFEAKYTADQNYPLLMAVYERALGKRGVQAHRSPAERVGSTAHTSTATQ